MILGVATMCVIASLCFLEPLVATNGWAKPWHVACRSSSKLGCTHRSDRSLTSSPAAMQVGSEDITQRAHDYVTPAVAAAGLRSPPPAAVRDRRAARPLGQQQAGPG